MLALGGLLSALVACAAPPEPAPLGELCGAREPVQVLRTGPTRVLTEAPLRLGERALYTTRELLEQGDETLKYGAAELNDVGACGESPRPLAGLERAVLRERWPGVALACDRERGQIVAVDLQGGEPRALYSDCGVAWSGQGRISVSEASETRDFVFLHPDPATADSGPVAAVELFGPVRLRAHEPAGLQVLTDHIFALSLDDSVVSVDLRTRAVSVEQTGVRYFYVSADGRYLLWQGLELTSGPESTKLRGPVVLYDRERGVGIGLGETSLDYSKASLRFADQGVMVLTQGGYQQIYRLPDLSFVDVPEGLVVDPLGPLDAHRWIVRGQWSQKTHVIDIDTGVTTPLFRASTLMIGREPDVAWLIEMRPCCDEGSFADEGPVWRAPTDGGPAVQVADRASRYFVRVGTQLVTVVDIDVDAPDAVRLGTLIHVDLETGGERVVADRVFPTSLRADAQTGVVSYSRSDGEASGVWQLALPRPEE